MAMVPGQGLLNSNSGFGTGAYYGPSGPDPSAALAAQGYQSRLGAAQQGGIQSGLLGQSLAGQMAQARLASDTQKSIAQTQANASMYPSTLRQQRFNQTFPVLSNALTSGAQTFGNAGPVGTQPTISANPIWSDNQVQQQVNNMRATNQQTAATQGRTAAQQLGGRGFGTQSPLLAELNSQYQGQAMGASTTGENNLRYNAAQGNAQQVLAGQTAQENQYASRQNEAIQRSQVYQGYLSSVLGSLAALAS